MKTGFLIVLLTLSVFGQKSVTELKPAHAAALQQFLSTHPDHKFLAEHVLDDDELRSMRQYIRKDLKPYYLVGDFNGDRHQDFAMILVRSGGSANPEGDENLSVVVFNGISPTRFRVAHIERVETPFSVFLNLSDEKRPRLYFALFESDAETFILTPAGKGYIVEFEPSR